MHTWRQAVVVTGLAVALSAGSTTVLAQRQFQFFAHFADSTGKPITDADATDPAYWAQQMRQPVRFMDGVGQLMDPGGDFPELV